MSTYQYENRALFESMLIENNYAKQSAQAYGSGLVNPNSSVHERAQKLWDLLMDDIEKPPMVDNPRVVTGGYTKEGGYTLPNRRSNLKPEDLEDLDETPQPKPTPQPQPPKEVPMENKQESEKMIAIKGILALEISETLKMMLIAALMEA